MLFRSGSICPWVTVFLSKGKLQRAVNACLKLASENKEDDEGYEEEVEEADCANSPHGPIAQWNVSSVINMDYMFSDAASFKQELCGDAWVQSVASKTDMFVGSSGSISIAVCAAFASKAELQSAVDTCLKLSLKGPHGAIAEWDVSSVTDMADLFAEAKYFNGDLSKWDVSSVTDMTAMFLTASSFNGDLSKWDVSSVTSMSGMFMHATSLNKIGRAHV